MPDEKPIVVVRDLVVRFTVGNGRAARQIAPVDGVSFSIAPGEVLALVGESGSGKSTLGKTLVRFHRPFSGQIQIDGQTVEKIRSAGALRTLRKSTQMIFQDPFGSLNPVRTVGQHLRIVVRRHHNLQGGGLEDRINELLERVGLIPGYEFKGKYPHELSGGQRQRVAIARALAVNPKFIVADEPISMLDVSIRADILKLLRKLQQDLQVAYLYITHDLASARYFGDRIMVMYGGQVMETGTADQVVGTPGHPYTRLLLASTAGSDVDLEIGETSIEAPDLFVGRSGCPFAHRCPAVTELCSREQPTLRGLPSGQQVACHHA